MDVRDLLVPNKIYNEADRYNKRVRARPQSFLGIKDCRIVVSHRYQRGEKGFCALSIYIQLQHSAKRLGEALRKAGYMRECRRKMVIPSMCIPFARVTPNNLHSTLPPLQSPFSFLSYSLYYVTTTKDNTVKEKGLQEVFILRYSLPPSFYASTAEGIRKSVDRRRRKIKPNEVLHFSLSRSITYPSVER